ncbi:MAG: hypothetical protein J2O38_03440 [Acidimicrobiales bacterium]|nr:hypothetical protein [Acidimicrobiales bacterium]
MSVPGPADRGRSATRAGLTRAFIRGLAAVVVALAGLGALIGVLGTGRDRPSGVAATWLGAVSDTTRSGVHADAVRRADALGPVSLAGDLIPARTDGHGAFSDFEVGRGAIAGGEARVPFLLHQHGVSGPAGARRGTIVLREVGGAWRVVGIEPPQPGLRVPSEGGPSLVGVPLTVWLGAAGVVVLLAVVADGLVRWSGRASRLAATEGLPS